MTGKLARLAAGRPLRIEVHAWSGDAVAAFEPGTFAEYRLAAAKLCRDWYWHGLFAGNELLAYSWRTAQ